MIQLIYLLLNNLSNFEKKVIPIQFFFFSKFLKIIYLCSASYFFEIFFIDAFFISKMIVSANYQIEDSKFIIYEYKIRCWRIVWSCLPSGRSFNCFAAFWKDSDSIFICGVSVRAKKYSQLTELLYIIWLNPHMVKLALRLFID